ncbi:MAG: hypothetical protein QOE36_2309, partial [Gaiellaceae bacterium]|nr:hypothetical protein [Gaiellaceae bacterium]
MIRSTLVVAVLIGVLLVPLAGATRGAAPREHALIARNVLPPGQSGSLAFPPSARDQMKLYDALTPLFDQVTNADIARDFKPETLGLGGAKVVRVERPRGDVRILRDRWEVPHVYGSTRAGTEFGAGWVTAEDRGLLMELLRGPGRISALDVPGLDAFAVANAARQFIPTAATNAVLHEQIALVQHSGARGRQLLR